MTMTHKVLILGIGAVGTIAAYALKVKGLSEVTCVARSSYEVLKTRGFDIESVDYGNVSGFKPDHVERTVEDSMKKWGPFDYVIVSTKNIPDVHPIEPLLDDCWTPETAIALLQNGIGIEKPVFKRFPLALVISGVSLIGATLYHDKVKHVTPDIVAFGPFINPSLPKQSQISACKTLVDLYSSKSNKVTYEEDVKLTRWRKLVYNTTINTTCALTGVDSGRLDLFGGMDSIVKPAMGEVVAVAKADGVSIPQSLVDFFLSCGDGEYYPPSMLIDMRKDNYTEFVTIIANVLEIAAKLEVPTPTLTVLSNLLQVIQMRTMERRGRFVLPEKRPPVDYKIQYKD